MSGRIEPSDEERVHAASLILRLRSLGVSERNVLKAMETVPRRLFVPEEFAEAAYEDRPLPIGLGQTISAPSVVAKMTEALEVGDRHSVLEIGTGSGFHTAILARLARRVTTIERHRELTQVAQARWRALGITNITPIVGDGMAGWPRQAPFDRILGTAAFPEPPSHLVAQLTDTGILIAPVGLPGGAQRLTLFQRSGKAVDVRDIADVIFVPMMPGVAPPL